LGWIAHSTPRIWLVGVWALIGGHVCGCHVYDERKLDPQAQGGSGGAAPLDSGIAKDGAGLDDDGGGAGVGGECVAKAAETCNLRDDDCDGDTDEDTEELCAMSFPNVATAECVEIRREARCVQRDCSPGFFNCDGIPSNGCEPYCMCHVCPDDDAGVDLDGGS
jgi:hypothetical protein